MRTLAAPSAQRYSEANAWKKVGSVPSTPSASSTSIARMIGPRATFFARHTPKSTAHDAA